MRLTAPPLEFHSFGGSGDAAECIFEPQPVLDVACGTGIVFQRQWEHRYCVIFFWVPWIWVCGVYWNRLGSGLRSTGYGKDPQSLSQIIDVEQVSHSGGGSRGQVFLCTYRCSSRRYSFPPLRDVKEKPNHEHDGSKKKNKCHLSSKRSCSPK